MTNPTPTQTPKIEDPKFGFNDYAERLNGRAAMIGFALTLLNKLQPHPLLRAKQVFSWADWLKLTWACNDAA